jgi:1-acyl-sn-glycerol-3-phosphate acyltransferase
MGPSERYPAFHPVPALRLAASFGGTVWAVGSVNLRRPALASAHVWARRMVKLLGVEPRLESPIPDGAQVWVSNHLSWLDPLIYLSLRPAMALAKAEVAAYPLIGQGAARIVRFVDRADLFSRAAALRGIVKDLDAGEDFLLFPEGTTTCGDHLAPLYEGGLRMAYRMGVKLLPLRLATSAGHYPWIGDDSLVPHLKRMAQNRVTRVSIHPGSVLDPAVCADEELWVRTIRQHLAGAAVPVA